MQTALPPPQQERSPVPTSWQNQNFQGFLACSGEELESAPALRGATASLWVRASLLCAAPLYVTSVCSQCSLEPLSRHTFPLGPNEARKPGARQGFIQASESSCFIGSYSFFSNCLAVLGMRGGTRVGGPLVTMGGGGMYRPTPRAQLRVLLLVADVVLMEWALRVPGPPPLENLRALLPMVPPKVSRLPEPPVELTTAEGEEKRSPSV